MRFLVAIFSIYLIGLSLVPCSDDLYKHSPQQQITLEQKDIQHNLQNHKNDDCSPFCQCHCCHVHVTEFGQGGVTIFLPYFQDKNFNILNNFGEEHLSSLLDPPRV